MRLGYSTRDFSNSLRAGPGCLSSSSISPSNSRMGHRRFSMATCFSLASSISAAERIIFNASVPLPSACATQDHSTFSKNRHGRFRDSDTFRHVFESVLRRCMTEGLVGGERFAIDASVVRADANRARGVPGAEAIDWKSGAHSTRAVREYVAALEEANPTETPPKSV